MKMLAPDGKKNLIGQRLRELRKSRRISQEQLMAQLQLLGFDSERGVIKRIENGARFVSDIELKLLAKFFDVSFEFLINGVADIVQETDLVTANISGQE